jgi:hypothetical protein
VVSRVVDNSHDFKNHINRQTGGKMMKTEIKLSGLYVWLGLALLALAAGSAGCATDSAPASKPTDFRPTLSGDNHAVPVYTSPTNDLTKP